MWPALQDLSFAVRPGRCVALVGESGAGKSTAAKLALRFADPDHGAVRLDGHDVRDLTLRSLRENVGLLLQDAPLLDGTIRENVAYGLEATDEQVRAALAAVGLALDPATRRVSAAARCRAASGDGSRWRACCCRTRRCSCSTSRRRASTPMPPGGCSSRSSASSPTAPPC